MSPYTYAPPNGGRNPVIVSIPLDIATEGEEYGRLRYKANANRLPESDLGAFGLQADISGAIAELLVYRLLRMRGLSITTAPMFAERAVGTPDFTLGSRAFDVKCIPRGKKYLNINLDGHSDAKKRPNYYVPICHVCSLKMALYTPVSALAVSQWPKRYGHSWYTGVAMDRLHSPDILPDWLDWFAALDAEARPNAHVAAHMDRRAA